MTVKIPHIAQAHRFVVTSGLLHDLNGRLSEYDRDVAMRLILDRHFAGDWGDVDPQDKKTNDAALTNGSRIVSSYKIVDVPVWVITDAETDGCYRCMVGMSTCPTCHGQPLSEPVRQVTTILRPEDY